MMNTQNDSNYVFLSGRVKTDLTFSHEIFGEKFYWFELEVPRLSQNMDIIPVVISERIIANISLKIDLYIKLTGQFRSYNNYEGEKSKLVLNLFVKDIDLIQDISEVKDPNEIILNGYICKKPIYRQTPFGREIADLLLAVNRGYNKSDYIPCIAWGRNAKYSDSLVIGDNLKIWGRIQSRNYEKKLENGQIENKRALEISITKLELQKE